MNLKAVLIAINELQADGVIERYAIGGAVAAGFYFEPDTTKDVDVFIVLEPKTGQLLISLSPIYDYLAAKGYLFEKDGHPNISGWPVDFIPVSTPLLKEALDQSVEHDLDGVRVQAFSAEHLAAIALEVGRPKDKTRLLRFFESDGLDQQAFSAILQRHGLMDRWMTFKKQMLG